MKIRKVLVAILAAIMIINVSSPALTTHASDIEDNEEDNDQYEEYIKVTGVSTHIPKGTLGKDSDIYMEVSYSTNIEWSRYFEVVYDVEGLGEQKFRSTTLDADEETIRIDLGKYMNGQYRLKKLMALSYNEDDRNKIIYNYDSQTKKLINEKDSSDIIEAGNCNYTIDGDVESGFTFEKMWLELPNGMTKDTVKEGTELYAV